MTAEMLRVFDENMNHIGEKAREEIHRDGDWHETFHCWFAAEVGGEWQVLFQKRADSKKDYPGLFDITSAGHLLSTERIEDGVREVEEELGAKLAFADLIPLGVFKEDIHTDQIWDREFCHVFVYKYARLPEFSLQKEEVDSLFKAPLDEALSLFNGTAEEVELIKIGNCNAKQKASATSFVGHGTYYIKVFEQIKQLTGCV